MLRRLDGRSIHQSAIVSLLRQLGPGNALFLGGVALAILALNTNMAESDMLMLLRDNANILVRDGTRFGDLAL